LLGDHDNIRLAVLLDHFLSRRLADLDPVLFCRDCRAGAKKNERATQEEEEPKTGHVSQAQP
jgi:hypothetical protein